MRCTLNTLRRLVLFLAAAITSSVAWGSNCPDVPTSGSQRYIVVISDTHMGLGKTAGGVWHPTEDFRWGVGLANFLERIAECGRDEVDLVIAGDLLELWQPPSEMTCGGPADAICPVDHFERLTKIVIEAHDTDIKNLGRFASRGNNRLFLVPGNHDAALLLPRPLELLRSAFGESARFVLVSNGVWKSDDGEVIVEHGHQIGQDVNRYENWPTITSEFNGAQYVVSPWGERFVQKLFNEQEVAYPIIDNLSPETAGARFRMADRGLWSSVKDVARFLQFNLFETALSQKVNFLGEPPVGQEQVWSVPAGRARGHKLFLLSLPPDDPFSISLKGVGAEAAELRKELDALAVDESALPDDDVRALCELMAIRSDGRETCIDFLGGAIEKLLFSKRSVVSKHIEERLREPGLSGIRLFVYGHTHQLELEWEARAGGRQVSVFNSGAFQRVVDEAGFRRRAGTDVAAGLRNLRVDDLAPCYGAVVIGGGAGGRVGKTVIWKKDEADGQPGEFTTPEDKHCQ